jgi:hypothetical protein
MDLSTEQLPEYPLSILVAVKVVTRGTPVPERTSSKRKQEMQESKAGLMKFRRIHILSSPGKSSLMENLGWQLNGQAVRRIKQAEGRFTCLTCSDEIPSAGSIFFLPCGHYMCIGCYDGLLQYVADLPERPGAKCYQCLTVVKENRVFDYASFKKVHP